MSAFLKQDTNLSSSLLKMFADKRGHPFTVNLLQKCEIENSQILFVCKMRATYPFAVLVFDVRRHQHHLVSTPFGAAVVLKFVYLLLS